MYPGYSQDRRALGYSVIKDSSSEKELFTVILIFSKKVLVGVIILLRSKLTNMDRMDQDSHFVLSQPPQVFISRLKSYDSSYEDRKLNKHIKEYILRIQGGSNDNSNDDIEELNRMEQLRTSIISKTKQSLPKKLSINKILQRIFKILDSIISRQEFWKILKLLEIPTEFESSEPNEVKWSEPSKKSERATKKSSLFAEAFVVPPPDKKHYWISPMTNNPIENSFSHGLMPSGISVNHKELPEKLQKVEKLTQLRRAEPRYSSQVLGESFQYSKKQLEKKAPDHLPDFGISIEGMTLEEQGLAYCKKSKIPYNIHQFSEENYL